MYVRGRKGGAMTSENMKLNPELMEKAKACTSPEELMDLAKGEHQELSIEELDAASGGIIRDGVWICNMLDDDTGDMREDIDSARVHADFMNGSLDGGEFF